MSLEDIVAAARHRAVPRLRFAIGDVDVGSVALAHVPLLRTLSPGLVFDADTVTLDRPEEQRTAWFSAANAALRSAGAIRGWRDEIYAVVDPAGGEHAAPLALIERAAARFWGTLTFGAHANGYVAGDDGRPQSLWIARRSLSKATDPGRLDNLIGGGVPQGQTPRETLLREAWEEAGLPAALAATAVESGVVEVERDVPQGLQHERLHGFDLALPEGWTPVNQDGEVSGFFCLAIDAFIARTLWREMAVDAALVTVDFLRRHGWLAHPGHARH